MAMWNAAQGNLSLDGSRPEVRSDESRVFATACDGSLGPDGMAGQQSSMILRRKRRKFAARVGMRDIQWDSIVSPSMLEDRTRDMAHVGGP